ncbi:hypothetical protein [Streptomyces sp. MP131-18]|uniref:hypothetical protein n=1 Tax=Streptomyces sp. MP131-18 TaxID=1857892 RepID=UPI00117C2FC2|nr:hypothetical protein [Streptomyces sp. MP131-18]
MTDQTRLREMDDAAHLVRTGLKRLRAAADVDDVQALADVLRLTHDHHDREAGVLHALAALLGTVWTRLAEIGEEHTDQAADRLMPAVFWIEDEAGDRIDRVRETLAQANGTGSTTSVDWEA